MPLLKPRVSWCHKKDIILSEDVDLQQLAQSLERYSGADVAWLMGPCWNFLEERWKTKGLYELYVYMDVSKNRGTPKWMV